MSVHLFVHMCDRMFMYVRQKNLGGSILSCVDNFIYAVQKGK